MRALSLPGCACRGAFQFAVMAKLAAKGERFDLVAGASSGAVCGAAFVAGLAEAAPAIARRMAKTPIVSPRYLETERSVFGLGKILRDLLREHLPEHKLVDTDAELLVATTRAHAWTRRLLAHRREPPRGTGLVVHSNRSRRNMHEVLLASCHIPLLHAGVTRIDGEVHIDGAFADNTLVDALVSKGAREITIVTPFANAKVARTMFADEGPFDPHPSIPIRILYPARPLSIGRFDFAPERIEEAIAMPYEELLL